VKVWVKLSSQAILPNVPQQVMTRAVEHGLPSAAEYSLKVLRCRSGDEGAETDENESHFPQSWQMVGSGCITWRLDCG
jgi:hypothetical protein